ncbi:hypothetical protein KVR01_001847 [Diaporthe batatas]|uniref:uncharacterized protein n=1 Tax=Diaporthe batatas TaxID=748121 RepID=UPI001D05B366|nr:uncharacterized protein KVR01_001847 [Diaporthe batatas]KAG8169098.1 hypothetical protein KVR01_001847 [Diaporthe batatas]
MLAFYHLLALRPGNARSLCALCTRDVLFTRSAAAGSLRFGHKPEGEAGSHSTGTRDQLSTLLVLHAPRPRSYSWTSLYVKVDSPMQDAACADQGHHHGTCLLGHIGTSPRQSLASVSSVHFKYAMRSVSLPASLRTLRQGAVYISTMDYSGFIFEPADDNYVYMPCLYTHR